MGTVAGVKVAPVCEHAFVLEIGAWYRWGEWPPGIAGRPVRITADRGDGLYAGRWANGLEVTVFAGKVGDPLPAGDAPVPGLTEPCAICDGGMVPVHAPTDKPWVSLVVGARPCPNCRGNASDRSIVPLAR